MANLRNYSTIYVKQGVCAVLGATQATNRELGLHSTVRTFTRTSQLAKSRNFYDDLEIPRTSTQSEIKSAYYTLSMIYHPDKNKSEQAKSKFRRITEAYEVLGNFRSRRMYDKGIGSFGHKVETSQSPGTETEIMYEEPEDDAQTKFYKQHMVKSQPPVMANRVSARDFDKWSADRIRESFEQKQRVKEVLREREDDKNQAIARSKGMGFISYAVIFIILVTSIQQWRHNKLLDEDLQKRNRTKS